MSHSQFHSTNLFILRHAWLNLWDKHMTTGRINQVTTFRITPSRGRRVGTGNNQVAFPTGSSSTELCSVLDLDSESVFRRSVLPLFNVYRIVPPCHQVSHVSDTASPGLFLRPGSRSSLKTTSDRNHLGKMHTVAADLRVVIWRQV